MADTNRILKSVLRKITPDEFEHAETEKVLERVKEAAGRVLKRHKLTFIIAGSYVRNTYMRDKKEFDLFVLFPEKWSRERLEKTGLDIGKKITNLLKGMYRIAYAEHPYVRSRVGGYAIDIVPCYKVKSATRIKSAVDRTPFHNKWLNRNLPQELTGDVRLLKQFCKGQGVYGSDTKVLGLSGYLCELLTIHYGGFRNFMESAKKWAAGQVFIDPEGFHTNPEKIKPRFKNQPLIIIDPVDPNRNVAAALSPGNFAKLVDGIKRFLKKPGQSYFFRKPPKITLGRLEKLMKKRRTKLLALVFEQPQIIQDVLWPQLRRGAKRLEDIMEEYEFHVIGWDVWSNEEFTKNGKCVILLEMEVWELPDIRKIRGPPVFIQDRSEEFIRKYGPKGRMLVEDSYWKAEISRKWRTAEAKLKDTLSDPEKILRAKGIPSYIAKSVSKKFRIDKQDKILKLAKKNPEFGQFLMDYFEREVL